MKQTLLLLLVFIASYLPTRAQVLITENFNALTIGNVSSDITGATAGQNGWYTYSTNGAAPTTTTNANVSNLQIVASGNGGTKGLKIVAPNGNKGSRYMWKDVAAVWATRTSGNNIIQVEYDFFTGPATTSKVQSGMQLFADDNSVTPAASRTINGFVYTMDTRVLTGVAYLNNAGTYGTYLINLAAAPGVVLTSNTWYRIGFSFDSTTGEVKWKGPGFYGSLPNTNWAGPFDPNEIDFVSAAPSTNAATSDMIFDNLTISAVVTESLLGVKQLATINSKKFSIYPNPANNIVNVSNDDNIQINDVKLTDINGRTVKSVSANATQVQINISDLNAGVYFMNIETNEGSAIKKIIKN